MQINNHHVSKGRIFMLFLVILFLAAQVWFSLTVLEIEEDAVSIIFLSIFFLAFFFLTSLGIVWAKWVLTILIVLWGALVSLTGFETDQISLKLLSLVFLYIGIVLHFSTWLKAFFISKRTINSKNQTENPGDASAREVVYSPLAPSLLKRVQASFVDFMFIFLCLILIFSFTESLGITPVFIKIVVILFAASYEPFLTATSCTLGQKLIGIRVRDYQNQSKKISFIKAYARLIVKTLLGLISYFSIHSNSEKRAIHDYLANSIMVIVK